jgi:uncharacterized protein (TIGR03067 family)
MGIPVASFGQASDLSAEELKHLAGTWKPVSAENNGYKASEAELRGTLWTRDTAGKWVARRDGETLVEWSVKSIDAMTSPKSIDIEVAAGNYKGVVYKGIYELVGDTLRICFALPDRPVRPSDFWAGPGSVRALTEFERQKD